MSHPSRVQNILQDLRHFAELPDEIQQAIAASAIRRHFEAGQVVYVEGEPADFVYISNSKFEKGRGDEVRFRGDDKPKSQASKSNGALS